MEGSAARNEPAFIAASVTDNDGNSGRSLRGDVKVRRVTRRNAVEVPAGADVTELERSCESATHSEGSYSALLVDDQ